MRDDELSDEGRAYALANPESVVACVALQADAGEADDWPEAFRRTSIRVMNECASRPA